MRRRTVIATIAAAATLSGVGGFAFNGAQAAPVCVNAPGAGGPETAPRRVCTPDLGRGPTSPCGECGGPVPSVKQLVADAYSQLLRETNPIIYETNNTIGSAWEDAGQILGGVIPVGPIPLPKRPELPYLPGGGAP